VQSSSQIVTTNIPTSNFFTGRMPFLSPNQQCQSTEGRYSVSLLNINVCYLQAGYDPNQALVLCHMNDFRAGVLYLYEKMKLYVHFCTTIEIVP